MVIEIDDELLATMQLSERDVRIEFFAHLFDRGRLSFGRAASLAGVTPSEMEDELRRRDIPRFRVTDESFGRDLEALRLLGSNVPTTGDR